MILLFLPLVIYGIIYVNFNSVFHRLKIDGLLLSGEIIDFIKVTKLKKKKTMLQKY